jgi:hypothetical protein
VRRDALAVFTIRTGAFQGFADLPPLDQAAVSEALASKGNPWQPMLRDYLIVLENASHRPWAGLLERIAEIAAASLRELFDEMIKAIQPFLNKLRKAVATLLDSLTELAEAIGAVKKAEPPPFVWQQRSRRPDVRPVHSVDAVAAGRSPSTWFRTRIRGGRR